MQWLVPLWRHGAARTGELVMRLAEAAVAALRGLLVVAHDPWERV